VVEQADSADARRKRKAEDRLAWQEAQAEPTLAGVARIRALKASGIA
jgi:hypothetical protein